jgi:hypothetical protein
VTPTSSEPVTAPMSVLRRFAVEWISGADAAVCDEIMSPNYRVEIGGVTLDGLEPYRQGTAGQLTQFPGLLITVHEVVNAGAQVAMRFTEHGPSIKHDGRAAAWRGIGLFYLEAGQLVRNLTEEDYAGRRRQLEAGVPDRVDAPAVAPWSTPVGRADPAAEQAVRRWLESDCSFSRPGVEIDDGRDAAKQPLLDVAAVTVTDMFSAGAKVAFRVQQTGLPTGVAGWSGDALTLSVVGIVSVGEDGAISGHIVRDAAGFGRAIRAAAGPRSA